MGQQCGDPCFPVSSDLILKYALALDEKECGPTVLPSFRMSIKWVTSKLAIDCPDLSHPALLAVQSDIIQKRATTLKEAQPIPIVAVGSLEQFVTNLQQPDAAGLFAWWWLCMVFASLRFDDAMHVRPTELIMQDKGLFGVAWQTKVERKRRGTKFVVPRVGFRDSAWLDVGWDLLQLEDLDRDFWMRDLNTQTEFRSAPAQYQRSILWLRFIGKLAIKTYFSGPEGKLNEAVDGLLKVTARSARVTMLDAAVHARRSTEEIGLQASWKNPGPPVLKYTRDRTSVPTQMVQQLVKDMVDNEHPFEADEDVVLDSIDEMALNEVQFYVKTEGARASRDYRYDHPARMHLENRVPAIQPLYTMTFVPERRAWLRRCWRQPGLGDWTVVGAWLFASDALHLAAGKFHLGSGSERLGKQSKLLGSAFWAAYFSCFQLSCRFAIWQQSGAAVLQSGPV